MNSGALGNENTSLGPIRTGLTFADIIRLRMFVAKKNRIEFHTDRKSVV